MHCRFDPQTGDWHMYDSGLENAEPLRPATHDEIATFYLYLDMYQNPERYADQVETRPGWRQGVLRV